MPSAPPVTTDTWLRHFIMLAGEPLDQEHTIARVIAVGVRTDPIAVAVS
jgi:hypothetical protein